MSTTEDPERYMACALRLRLHATPFNQKEVTQYKEQVRLVNSSRQQIQNQEESPQRSTDTAVRNGNFALAVNKKVDEKKRNLQKQKKAILQSKSNKGSDEKNIDKGSKSSGANLSNYTFGQALFQKTNENDDSDFGNTRRSGKQNAPKRFNFKKEQQRAIENASEVITMDSNDTVDQDNSEVLEDVDRPSVKSDKPGTKQNYGSTKDLTVGSQSQSQTASKKKNKVRIQEASQESSMA